MSVIRPEFEQARLFIDLFAPGESFTFQTLLDKKKEDFYHAATSVNKPQNLTCVLNGTLEQHWAELKRLNQLGAGIFVTVNRTDLMGRKESNIVAVRAVFVDLDDSPLEPIRAHSVHPNIIVESSPGRWHAYWLTDGCSLEDFRDAQKRLAHQFNGDTTVCDLPRVMRLPGFFHQKSQPFMTKLIYPEA